MEGKIGAIHCLVRQHCFIFPTPPNFGMSLQCTHSEQSSRQQGSHCLQLNKQENSIEEIEEKKIYRTRLCRSLAGRFLSGEYCCGLTGG